MPDRHPTLQSVQPHVPEPALHHILEALTAAHYRHITISPASHATVLARPQPATVDPADVLVQCFGWSRPVDAHTLPHSVYQWAQHAQILTPVNTATGSRVRSQLRVSSVLDAGRWFLFWHSAYPTDHADSVFFGPDTYRFVRAVGAWLDLHQPKISRAIDLCTGAGPAAITLAARYPNADVMAGDINTAALALLAVNAAHAQTHNVRPCQSNLLQAVDGTFDLVVANPPYLVDRQARAYRHGGGPLGAALALAIVDEACPRLNMGGSLLLYTGVAIMTGHDPFYAAVCTRVAVMPLNLHIDYQTIDPDVFGEELHQGVYQQADRIAAVLLVITRVAPKNIHTT